MNDAIARPIRCFLRACELDVAVRKPGNVSRASPGHGMHADLFIAASQAAAGPLFRAGASVGERIEAATAASMAVAGCNTNLGILLLCAPLAAAAERRAGARHPPADLRSHLTDVLAALDVNDTRAAYRAITLANPGGLGDAAAEDVRGPPRLGLREAMALAAGRDRIALQYATGYGDLFGVALAALPGEFLLVPPGPAAPVDAATTAAVQALYLTLLRAFPDSHIVRKHGAAVAHNVMVAAQGFDARVPSLDAHPAFVAWDERLKAEGLNPGTSADFTVATLLLAGLLAE